ncbi:hypothetical protein TNCV_2708831 [Trichonephila clavipes]|nr:hypothetical protein TNCV_2708831 [Trichonephila clavipes]
MGLANSAMKWVDIRYTTRIPLVRVVVPEKTFIALNDYVGPAKYDCGFNLLTWDAILLEGSISSWQNKRHTRVQLIRNYTQSTVFMIRSTRANCPRVTHENVLQGTIPSSPVCVHGEGNCSTVEDGAPIHNHRRAD